MQVKICGITDVRVARKTCEYGADALGFVFAKSKRQVTPEQATAIIAELPEHVLKIGVFVNEEKERVEEIVNQCGLDYAQLHGDEDEDYCRELVVPVIKAFGVASQAAIEQALQYDVEYVLFDSPKEEYYGGNGKAFDWSVLRDMPAQLRKKLILAGGLGAHNVKEAIQLVQPYMIDASSSLETGGKKDLVKIQQFIQTIKER